MTESNVKLLPCPFCGSTNVAQGASREAISVWCFCGAQGPSVPFPEINPEPIVAIHECFAAWNRRAVSPTVNLEAGAGDLRDLIGQYFDLGYAEGVAGRDTDTMAGDAQAVWSEIDARISEAAAQLAAVTAERDGLAKDLAAQIAGHQLTASQSTGNLMRANTATSKLDEAEARARKHWQAFRDLRLEIIGDGPMCRDCADENGRCPHSGQSCDPDEAVKEQIAAWKAAAAQLAAVTAENARLREALEPFGTYLDKMPDLDNKGNPLPDDQGMGWVYLTIRDFRAARAALSQEAPE